MRSMLSCQADDFDASVTWQAGTMCTRMLSSHSAMLLFSDGSQAMIIIQC